MEASTMVWQAGLTIAKGLGVLFCVMWIAFGSILAIQYLVKDFKQAIGK